MSPLNAVMDAYDRRARFYPMVLVLLPLFLGIACWAPSGMQLPGVLSGAAVTLAVAALLTQLARDQGKRREKELFRLWGGRPSDRALSYGGRALADATLARCHKKLMAIDPDLQLPASREVEKEGGKEARSSFAAATELLITRTRDKEKFPLLFKENVSYGFRRNLWGMKPAGILTSVLGACACGGKIVALGLPALSINTISMVCGGICALLGIIWCARITPSWVRIPAEGYSKQLVEACESL